MNFLASHLITVKVKLFEYIAVCFSFFIYSACIWLYARYYAVLAMCVKPSKDTLNKVMTEHGPSERSSPLKIKLLIKRRSLSTRALHITKEEDPSQSQCPVFFRSVKQYGVFDNVIS